MNIQLDEFMQRTKPASNDCIEWVGHLSDTGYGLVTRSGKHLKAHRLSWAFHNGEIPDGLHVLHHCDNRKCVNIDHLFLGTNADNVADKIAKGRQYRAEHNRIKTHCKQGHEYSQANTYTKSNGGRACRECGRIRDRLYYQKTGKKLRQMKGSGE